MAENQEMRKYFFEKDFSEFQSYVEGFKVTKKHYPVGAVISSQAETLNNGYFIVNGIMKLSIGTVEEKEKTLCLFGRGSIFPLGINEHHYPLEYAITETALTDLEAYEFEFMELRRMFLNNSELALRMVEHYCDLVSFLFYEIASVAANDSIDKVANILYELVSKKVFPNGVIPLSQAEIAALVGVSKIQVARAYACLKGQGILRTSRNSLAITDLPALKKFCSLDYTEF